MRRLLIIPISLIIIIFWSSCKNDFNFELSSGDLSFSKDTVYLDTIFTNIGSNSDTSSMVTEGPDGYWAIGYFVYPAP